MSYISEPAGIPPSFASLRRNVPLKVKERREQWPDHPSFTREPFTDPEVFDVDRPTSKRLPHEMEIQFEHMRSKGFFPGDPAVARTHFVDIMRLWRGRIRGQEGQVWDAVRKEWQTASRLAFFLEQMDAKGLPFPEAVEKGVVGATELSDHDLFLSGVIPIHKLEAGDVIAEVAERVLGIQANEVNEYLFTMMHGKVEYARKDGSEGLLTVDEETLRTHYHTLFDWPKILKRHADELKTAKRQSYRTRVVGHRVYLPNIIVRLTRNFTPPGQPYDPYIATFRIPTSMTKQDFRSYLKAVYNLDVSFVRTVVYWGEVVRDQRNGQRHRQKGGEHNYKKAIVGLYEPFHYPDDVHELRAISRAQGKGDKMYNDRMASINSTFYISEQKAFRRKLIQAVYKRSSYGHRSKGEGQSRVSVDDADVVDTFVLIVATHPRQDPGAPPGAGARDRDRGAQAPTRRQRAGRLSVGVQAQCMELIAPYRTGMLHAHAFIRKSKGCSGPPQMVGCSGSMSSISPRPSYTSSSVACSGRMCLSICVPILARPLHRSKSAWLRLSPCASSGLSQCPFENAMYVVMRFFSRSAMMDTTVPVSGVGEVTR